MSFIVAIDGPAGTGKGTVTKILSKKFNLVNIDTGATYRCVTLKLIKEKVSLDDTEKIKEVLNEIKIDKVNQNLIIQKLSNLATTGNDNISYKKSIDKLNKKQLEEIGTQKSREKPLNILLRENQNLEQEKDELEKYKITLGRKELWLLKVYLLNYKR